MDLDGSSREVSPKAKCTRSLSHKVDQKDEGFGCGGQDIWQKGSNRVAAASPQLLHCCLASQQDGTTVATVRFDPQFNQNRAIGPPQSKSSKPGEGHGSLWCCSRMGERMNALGTALVTTRGPGMRPLPRCHNASICQQRPDAHSDL